MHSFKDKTGRDWKVHITVGLLRQIKAKLGIDLLNPEVEAGVTKGDSPVNRFAAELETAVDIIWEAVEEQAGKEGVSTVDFARLLDGPVLADARRAFQEEWQDFFRSQNQSARAEMIKTVVEGLAQVMDLMTARIQEIDVRAGLETSFGKFTNSPGSSE